MQYIFMNLNFTARGAELHRCTLPRGVNHCSSCLGDCGKQNTETVSEPAGYKQEISPPSSTLATPTRN